MSYEDVRSPQLLVFAGPNGSGKSTVTKKVHPVGLYVNADDIKKSTGCTDLEAAQVAENMRKRLLESRRDFTFETVLSTERNMKLLAQAKTSGYQIQVIFVLTKSSSINVERVQERVKAGGHPVPEDKIVSRYKRSLQNIPVLARLVHRLLIFDNTGEAPLKMCEVVNGSATIVESAHWTKKEIFNLLAGVECPE